MPPRKRVQKAPSVKRDKTAPPEKSAVDQTDNINGAPAKTHEPEAETNNDTRESPATASDHIQALKEIDQHYQKLSSVEANLVKYLNQLQQEEKQLKNALEKASMTLREQHEKEQKKKNDEAVARLEAALMMDCGDSTVTSCTGAASAPEMGCERN